MADHFDDGLSDWASDSMRQWRVEREYEWDAAESMRESIRQDIDKSMQRQLEWQLEIEDMRKYDLDRLFTFDQMELLHNLPVPDPVPDDFYDELDDEDPRELLRRVKREERRARASSSKKSPADHSGPLARMRRIIGRRRRAGQSPTLQRAADILCAKSDTIGRYVKVGTAVSLCAFLLPSLAGTPTALVLTVSMLVAKTGVGEFCSRWQSK